MFRSVGFRGKPVPGVPFDESRGIIPNAEGRIVDPATGEHIDGSYVTGWIKRGPSGVIGTNKKCAKDTVAALLDDYQEGRLGTPPLPSEGIGDALPNHVDLQGWRLIDERERELGAQSAPPSQADL
ncbi:hypothetical protein AB0F17_53850 [Nonomuraea sp. NPDC026600]|uniref:hypothetical protein n=1 Tax=Nonomuraea sp. NPDC026600 TaxID=3155363 RepID=UPI0033FFC426